MVLAAIRDGFYIHYIIKRLQNYVLILFPAAFFNYNSSMKKNCINNYLVTSR
jgi:hypothetical protein